MTGFDKKVANVEKETRAAQPSPTHVDFFLRLQSLHVSCASLSQAREIVIQVDFTGAAGHMPNEIWADVG